MNLAAIVTKIFGHFKYENTAVALCDYEARFVEADAVAFQTRDGNSFHIDVSSKIGQNLIVHIPGGKRKINARRISKRLDTIFSLCVDKKVKSLALSLADLCGARAIEPEVAIHIVNDIFERVKAGIKLQTIVLCTKELALINTMGKAILSLTATITACGEKTYKFVHLEGKAPLELDKRGKVTTDLRGKVRAGSFGTWKLRYEVGRSFVKNAELAFAITHPSNWMIPQFLAGDAPGYSTVKTTGKAKLLAFRQAACGNKGFIIQFKVIEGMLRKGEVVEITLGDTSKGSPGIRVQSLSMDKQVIKVMGDFEDAQIIPWQHNDFVYGHRTIPSFSVSAGKAHMTDLICPTHVQRNRNFRGIIRLCDSVGNLCEKAVLEGVIVLDDEPLSTFKITAADQSHIAIRNLKLKSTGVHRLRLMSKNGKQLGVGNPVICYQHKQRHQMYWGDLHMHSNLSDGIGDPDFIYYSARNIAGLDIAALGDHDVILAQNEGFWEKTIHLAKKWHKPGKFVTLLGFEFTERKHGGDRNVYYLNDTGPLIDSGFSKMHPNKLYQELGRLKFKSMVIPHCVIGKNAWRHSDPRFCRLAEIYSTHGSSEAYPCDHYHAPDFANYDVYPPESSYSDSFSFGHKMGAVGGTDDHGGQPGWGYNWHNYRGGIMGVLATELTREAVWDALWERRTIATTGERIYLNMTVNDLMIGQEGRISGKPEIEIEALGTDKIDLIELLRNEEIIHCFHGNGLDEKRVFVDTKWNGKPAWYRCRLTQNNGERAWTSPVWVT